MIIMYAQKYLKKETNLKQTKQFVGGKPWCFVKVAEYGWSKDPIDWTCPSPIRSTQYKHLDSRSRNTSGWTNIKYKHKNTNIQEGQIQNTNTQMQIQTQRPPEVEGGCGINNRYITHQAGRPGPTAPESTMAPTSLLQCHKILGDFFKKGFLIIMIFQNKIKIFWGQKIDLAIKHTFRPREIYSCWVPIWKQNPPKPQMPHFF